MLKHFKKCDLWILDNIFQKIYEWIWKQWGISNFNLSRLCLTIGCILGYTLNLPNLLGKIGVFILFFFGLLLIKNIESMSRINFVNPARYLFFWYRGLIFICLLISVATPSLVAQTILVFYAYFFSCQQLPPMKKKKEFKWISFLIGAT